MRLNRPSHDGIASWSFVLLEIGGATVLVSRSGPSCQIYYNQQREAVESENRAHFTGARFILLFLLCDFALGAGALILRHLVDDAPLGQLTNEMRR